MATDFSKFKQMLEQKNASNQKKSGPTWFKAEKGEVHTLRFLPLKSQNLDLPIEYYHHHAINFPDGTFAAVACRKKRGEGECPFCNLASDTWRKYQKTDDEQYKTAFKQLIVKTQMLLVGFEPSKVDLKNLTEKDLKIVRATSKAAMDKIEQTLMKGKDFVDFESGRNMEIRKPDAKGDMLPILWDWEDDYSVALPGREGRKLWDKLIELSPDLSEIVASPTDERLSELYDKFMSSQVTLEDSDDSDAVSTYSLRGQDQSSVEDSAAYSAVEFDISALRNELAN